MKQHILLITGWGGGAQLLVPLKNALQEKGHTVELINIFNAFDENILAQHVEMAKQADVIAGWSLGGELAIVLANEVLKQTGEAKVLITMASSPCFVAAQNWPYTMSVSDFNQFKQSFERDPASTLKRFGMLVTKGVNTARTDLAYMHSLVKPQPLSLLRQGLDMLERLNLVDNLKNYSGRQLHLFADQDALVPDQIIQNMQKIPAKDLKIVTLVDTAHSFPFVKVEETCREIESFITSLSSL